jgi:biofilm protein TabA
MIADTLQQHCRYNSLSPRFAAAFDFLKKLPAGPADGRHDIDGDNSFALVQSYTTRPQAQGTFEAHQRHIDIQFILSGVETMLWAPLATLQVTQPYLAEKDVALFAMPAQATPLNLRAGEFAIFFPEDGHAPGLEFGAPSAVRKVVIKVRI